jgi:hypothetical protein
MPRSLNVSYQTLAKHLSAMLEIAAESALFAQDFIVRKAGRDESSAQNKRHNQADTQQSHVGIPFAAGFLTR